MEPDLYITPEEYEIAEKNGISRRILDARVRTFYWDKQKAITEPIKKRNQTPWGDWKDVCKKNGISYGAFMYRIKNAGLDPEVAATKPLDRNQPDYFKRYVDKKRILTAEHLKTMEKNGLCKATVHMRRRLGWSLEDAVNTPVLSPSEVGRRAGKASKMKKSV
ncbi:hypothetical protein [Terribacillus saccharophilus]|uniref:hypothetical protein n=1 Tax=Terribacillus saccharophilus TaxID=361277 RepID=UPI000BA715EE|nr:hypothetical protein [Terribacillus saccharophilus]PAF19716.1 hypothetical protein CHH51_01240 [Terribacillus saccharophilus]